MIRRRAALDLVAKARQAAVDGHQESADAHAARLAVVRDPAWRAQRMKDAQQDAATMKDPQAFLRQIEESIRVEEATLVKELDPAGGGTGLADARRALGDVADWIKELTPAELAAPVCCAEKGATLRTKIRTEPSATCQALVRPNYAYFDKTLPRSAPQVVIITPISRCFDTADRNNRDANSPRRPAAEPIGP